LRIKERNAKRLQEHKANIDVIFNSNVREIAHRHVVLDTADGERVLENDYVFIFAGGELPYEFLKKIGIQLHSDQI
jgi:thioredoxin reductase (NADPH)